MPRRAAATIRPVEPDPVHRSKLVSQIINKVMLDGKKSTAESIVYDALAIIAERTGKDPLETLEASIKTLTPALEVRSRRVGGATYQVPVEVPARRARTLAIRWLVEFARNRREKTMAQRLANELLDAQSSPGRRVQAQGRHLPHGAGQQGLRALPLVGLRRRNSEGSPRLTGHMRTPATTGLVLLALTTSTSAAAAADELIAPVGGPIDATGTHLAYSRPDQSGFRLVIDGRDAPVAPSPRPFDVDLGTDAEGDLVAVYTRQRSSRDVVWLDVATGRERAVPGASRPGRDEGAASVSRGRVAFAVAGRPGSRLRRASITGGGVETLPAPVDERFRRVEVLETELAGGVLAFTAKAGDGDVGRAQLWFARGTGRPQLLHQRVISVNQGSAFTAPSVSPRWVTAGFTHVGDGGDYSRAVRVSPRRGTRQEATLPDVPDRSGPSGQRGLQGLALGAGAAYSSACAQPAVDEPGTPPDCRLVRTTLRWRGVSG
jgi:small subunit ribosomal protein S7